MEKSSVFYGTGVLPAFFNQGAAAHFEKGCGPASARSGQLEIAMAEVATHCRRPIARLAVLFAIVCLVEVTPAVAATSLWWDTAYSRRFNIVVAVGANSPDKGYAGYTARIVTLDTQALIASGEMLSDCSDMRLTYFDGLAWQELPRHVLGCNTTTTDVRFMLVADIAAGGSDDNYYLYHSNPTPGGLPAMTPTNVYLWYDDASIDRSVQYVRGRIDNWHGGGWDNSLAWNPAGYYTYDNGDNFTSGYRISVDERDIYVEAEWFHTGCYPINMTTGMLVRGIIQSGTGGGESSNHYYASNKGHFPGCNGSGYNEDGDIVEDNRPTTTVNGPNPPALVSNQWRRQGLAAWLTGPTNLSYWDEDFSANWSALGYPTAANLHVSGTDNANENTGRGFAGIMTAQDQGRVRNILMRRYVFPEPVLTLTADIRPIIVLQKTVSTVYDPVNNTTDPKAIPGSYVDYRITAFNMGAGNVDADTIIVSDSLPPTVSLFVGDLGAAGSGPVEFTDGTGAAASGLTFSFGGLGDLFDDVEFSTDGFNWNYEPIPDADGFDPAVTWIRIRPGGTFVGTGVLPAPRFELRVRALIQ
jgi:hypothetical protein